MTNKKRTIYLFYSLDIPLELIFFRTYEMRSKSIKTETVSTKTEIKLIFFSHLDIQHAYYSNFPLVKTPLNLKFFNVGCD